MSAECPSCGSSDVTMSGYSFPAQYSCGACGVLFTGPEQIKVFTLVEGIRHRPELYADMQCKKCGGYKIGDAVVNEEDRHLVCKCETKENQANE